MITAKVRKRNSKKRTNTLVVRHYVNRLLPSLSLTIEEFRQQGKQMAMRLVLNRAKV